MVSLPSIAWVVVIGVFMVKHLRVSRRMQKLQHDVLVSQRHDALRRDENALKSPEGLTHIAAYEVEMENLRRHLAIGGMYLLLAALSVSIFAASNSDSVVILLIQLMLLGTASLVGLVTFGWLVLDVMLYDALMKGKIPLNSRSLWLDESGLNTVDP